MEVKLDKIQASVVDGWWFVFWFKHVTRENYHLHFLYILKIRDLIQLVSSVKMWQREMFVPLLGNDCYLYSLRTVTSPALLVQRNWVADGIQSQDIVHSPKKVLDHAMAEVVTRLSPWRPVFSVWPFPVGLLVGRVALVQVFHWVLWFFSYNLFPLMLHVQSFIHLPPMLYSLSI